MKQFEGTMSHYVNKQDYFEAKAEFYESKSKVVVILLEQTLDMLEYSHVTGEWAYDHKKVDEFIEKMDKCLEEED